MFDPQWFIPTRAGRTSRAGPPPASHRAHPRAGGENVMLMVFAAVCPGSSPRGQGKHTLPDGVLRCHRLIPA